MRILLSSPLPPPVGGIATWTTLFVDYCKEAGHTVQVVNTALIGRRSRQNQGKTYLIDELKRNALILMHLKRELHGFDPDVVYINTSCSKTGLLRDACIAFLSRKHKIVVHCHCDVETQINNHAFAARMLNYLIRKSACVFVLNMPSLQYIRKLAAPHVCLVPNFIQNQYVASAHNTRNHVERILFVGHVIRTKGLAEMVEAARQLPSIRFRLVGPVIADMSGYSVPSNIELAGRKTPEGVRDELKEADIFLLPSYTEGFSLALLEAMAVGLPVIATDVGANADMVENKGGKIIPAGESQEIVRAIQNMSEAAIRQEMSAWNIRKVKENYTKELVLNEIFHKLKNL